MAKQFPTFQIDLSTAKDVMIDYLLRLEAIQKELNKIESPKFSDLDELNHVENEFSLYTSEFFHLMSVADTDKSMNAVYEEMIPEYSVITSRMGQDKDSMAFYKRLLDSELNDEQRRVVDTALRSFRRSGIDLEPEKQVRFNEINQRLSELSNDFSNNVVLSRDAMKLTLTDDSRLGGIPENDKLRFAKQAEEVEGVEYVIGTNQPDYLAVMQYAEDEELRKTMYFNYFGSASSFTNDGEFNNDEIVKETIALRQEKAEILGFKNYAEYSLEVKMADTPKQVIDFLEDLNNKAKPQAKEEREELKAFAVKKGFIQEGEDLPAWTAALASRIHSEELFNVESEKIREYFPMAKAQEGLFWVIEQLFGYKMRVVTGGFDKYIEDLQLFEISKDDEVVAFIYGDFFARDGKRGGAWMSDYCDRYGDQKPVAFVTCNFSKPAEGAESLLSFDEVTTLFHEFGHALHHTLTTVETAEVAGISGVPWDAVELPSTFMEFFCSKPVVLEKISGHYKTGETLPQEMVEAMLKAEHHGAGSFVVRQMELSLVDMRVHLAGDTRPEELANEFRLEAGLKAYPEGSVSYNQFGHIFAGGYAAGYYSYKWADILASDIFETFEENGVICRETGQRYLEKILSQGGSREISDMFRDFKGRDPKPDAFLKYAGIKIA